MPILCRSFKSEVIINHRAATHCPLLLSVESLEIRNDCCKHFGELRVSLGSNQKAYDELLSQSEYDLFVKTSIPGHFLHHLLSPYRSSNLRERGHHRRSLVLAFGGTMASAVARAYNHNGGLGAVPPAGSRS